MLLIPLVKVHFSFTITLSLNIGILLSSGFFSDFNNYKKSIYSIISTQSFKHFFPISLADQPCSLDSTARAVGSPLVGFPVAFPSLNG